MVSLFYPNPCAGHNHGTAGENVQAIVFDSHSDIGKIALHRVAGRAMFPDNIRTVLSVVMLTRQSRYADRRQRMG